jgi:hypothetical protein
MKHCLSLPNVHVKTLCLSVGHVMKHSRYRTAVYDACLCAAQFKSQLLIQETPPYRVAYPLPRRLLVE